MIWISELYWIGQFYILSVLIIKSMQKQEAYQCSDCLRLINPEKKEYHVQYQCQKMRNQKILIDKYLTDKLPQSQSSPQIPKVQQPKQNKPMNQNQQFSIFGKSPNLKKTGSKPQEQKIKQQKKQPSRFKNQSYLNQNQIHNPKSYLSNKYPNRQKTSEACYDPCPQRATAQPLISFQHLLIECIYCGNKVSNELIDEHQIKCAFTLDCQFCGLMVKVIQFDQHLKNCEIKKMWEKEQAKSLLKQQKIDYFDEFSEDEQNYQALEEQSQQVQYIIPEQQWKNKKHKRLTNSKLGKLNYTSYRRKSQQKEKQQKSIQDEEEPCSICYVNFIQSETIIKLPCLHSYHPECIGKWFEEDDRCPICKIKVK